METAIGRFSCGYADDNFLLLASEKKAEQAPEELPEVDEATVESLSQEV